jgi:hypothetical protein
LNIAAFTFAVRTLLSTYWPVLSFVSVAAHADKAMTNPPIAAIDSFLIMFICFFRKLIIDFV